MFIGGVLLGSLCPPSAAGASLEEGGEEGVENSVTKWRLILLTLAGIAAAVLVFEAFGRLVAGV